MLPFPNKHRFSVNDFETLYETYNHPEFIHPDPLEFVLRFTDPGDQEIAGLVASSLAFGRVGHILNNLEAVFQQLPDPAADLERMSLGNLRKTFGSFRHRWISGGDLADLLFGIRRLRQTHGSLENCFRSGIQREDHDVVKAIDYFSANLRRASERKDLRLIPCPGKGSACKRLMLFLRWMVRKDKVDPGSWSGISPAMLIVPLDTYMFGFARAYGLTRRRAADLKSALEVTRFFKSLVPHDPVRYDFALTRPGIRREMIAPFSLA